MAAISSNGTGGGNWSAAASWAGGVVPAEGDNATIVAGDTITIDQNITVGNDTATAAITVNGILDVPYNITADYTLTLKGDLIINSGGEFNIADSTNHLDSARKFTIKTNYSASLADGKYGIICNDGGKFRTYGTIKSMETSLNAAVAALGTQITVQAGEYAGWKVGDQITIAVTSASTGPAYTEMRTIQAIDTVNHIITLTAGVTYAHAAGAQVCLLSHNIIITSFNTGFHGYVRNNSQTKPNFHIDYTELAELGANATGKYGAVTFYDDDVCGEFGHVSSHHNFEGIYIQNSDGNSIDYLNLHANVYGLVISNYSDNNVIGTINCSSCSDGGVILSKCRYNTITTLNSYSNHWYGVYISSYFDGGSIGTINVYNNDSYGIYLSKSANSSFGTINILNNRSTSTLSYITNSTFTTINVQNANGTGINITYCSSNTFGTVNIENSSWSGIDFLYCANNVITTFNISNSGWDGLILRYSSNNVFKNLTIEHSGRRGLWMGPSSNNIVNTGVFGEPNQNVLGDIGFYVESYRLKPYSEITFTKSVKLSSLTQVASMDPVGRGSFVKCHNIGGIVGAHKKWLKTDNESGFGIIESEKTIFRTTAPSVRFAPSGTIDWLEQVFNVPADANTDRNFSIYMRKDALFNGSVALEVRFMGEVIVAPVTKVMTNTFVEQTITAPAASVPENGVLELVVKVKGTLGYVYADDFTWS